MKALTDRSFFRTFDRLIAVGNPGSKASEWMFAGSAWRRERHSFSGVGHSFAVEVFTIAKAARPTWSLLVAREHWWASAGGDVLKDVRWARPVAGRNADILAWFRAQERALDGS